VLGTGDGEFMEGGRCLSTSETSRPGAMAELMMR